MTVPSERCTMKSPMVSFSKATSPRRMSWKTVRPAGTRTRSVYGSPAAWRRWTSSAASARHLPEYTQPRPSCLRGRALGFELFGRAEARVQVAALEQARDVLVVDAVALRLPVGAVRPRRAGALVPVQAHLLHRGDDLHDGLVRTTAEVGVLNAEDERPRMLTGEDEVVESCPCTAEVQVASRRRSEADAGMRGLGHRPPIIPHRPGASRDGFPHAQEQDYNGRMDTK